MEYASYARGAVELLNNDFSSVDDLACHVGTRPWLLAQIREADLSAVRKLQAEIGAIFGAAVLGDEDGAISLLNEALERHPITARLVAHDAEGWHLHVGDSHRRVPEVLAAEALFGLATLTSQLGINRVGYCAAPGCNRAFVDASPNRSKRYCSARCATRMNVAALRQRGRARLAEV